MSNTLLNPETLKAIENEAHNKFPILKDDDHATRGAMSLAVVAHISCAKDYALRLQQVEQENERLRQALDRLVKLKQHKDRWGKDFHYQQQQPLAWKQAAEALNQKQ